MKFFFSILTVFFIITSCTPVSVEKGPPIKERIVEEMSVIPSDRTAEETDDQPLIYKDPSNSVRVGILENEYKVLFSFYGLFSITGKNKVIFSKKRSAGEWKVIPSDNSVILQDKHTGEVIKIKEKVVFKPLQLASFSKVGKLMSGGGWKWENTRSCSYKGSIEFINIGGKLTVVNDVGIEQYLYGVVPSEMSASSPYEALKAQAVLARTKIFSKKGSRYKGKPYTLSDDIYSQVYKGISNMSDVTNRAVDETRDMILTYRGKPIETFFHSTCGGYTEGNDAVYLTPRLKYLQPTVDMPAKRTGFGDLSNERNFKRWIDSKPDSYCNLENKNLSPKLNFAKKFFRWVKKVKRSDVQRQIKNKTGKDIGTLKDIRVLKRGSSGKAVSVKASGTKGSVIIEKELNIRKALSPRALWSANIYIERTGVKNGIPSYFVYHGAGYGHGLGMCQVGAWGMAAAGENFKDILYFYFPGTALKIIDKQD